MSPKFKVGEVFIYQGCVICPEVNGQEGVVVALPKDKDWINEDGRRTDAGHYRVISSRIPEIAQTTEDHMRKKKPPAEPLARWEDCLWRPSRETVL